MRQLQYKCVRSFGHAAVQNLHKVKASIPATLIFMYTTQTQRAILITKLVTSLFLLIYLIRVDHFSIIGTFYIHNDTL